MPGIFVIGFVAPTVFNLLGISQHNAQVPFQHVEDRYPVGSGTFHHNIGHALVAKPGPQSLQCSDGCIEAPRLAVGFLMSSPGQDTAKEKTLADVNSGTAFDDLTHNASSPPKSRRVKHKLFHGLFAPIRGFTSASQVQFYPRGFPAIPATSLSSATPPE
jgi:hypothetical protein